jgi:hypothetical protein
MPPDDGRRHVSRAWKLFWVVLTAIGTVLGVLLGITEVIPMLNGLLHPEYQDVKVARTCGTNPGSSCGLTERTQPSPEAPPLLKKEHPEGEILTVVCQVQGASVKASKLPQATTVWSRTTEGGYVSNAYLEQIAVYTVTTPCPS